MTPLRAICPTGRYEPPHRHNPDGSDIFCLSTTAAPKRMLRFENGQKAPLHGRCGVVALRRTEIAAMAMGAAYASRFTARGVIILDRGG